MKVITTGGASLSEIFAKLEEVAENSMKKMSEQTDLKILGYEVHEAEVTFKFKVEGMEEPQLMTVEHHVGYPELFTWLVNMENEDTSTNEEESMYDDYTVSIAKGEEMQFEEIESLYEEDDLEEESVEEYGDMKKITYKHIDGFKVMQIMQNDKVIQEVKLIPKDSPVH